MASQQEPLSAFLRRSKQHFQSTLKDDAQVTLVAGNQSADLDSMSSAILYAYFASQGTSAETHIPVLSVPTEDITIRPEFTVAFQHAGIDAHDLITLSDFPSLSTPTPQPAPERTRWILVDHNKLEGELAAAYSAHVVGVVDHHVDEGATGTAATPRRIEVCGSCTSLVVHEFSDAWQKAAAAGGGSEAAAQTNAQLARLALASILVDTNRLKNESKTRDVDTWAAKRCVEVIRAAPGGGSFKKKPFCAELQAAKRDVSSLSPDALLRKDYKAWTEAGLKLGMSSVPVPLAQLRGMADEAPHPARVHGEDAWDQVQREFIEARGLDLHAILAPFLEEGAGDGEGKSAPKGLLVQWRGDKAKTAVDRFEDATTKEIMLERSGLDGMSQEKVERRIWALGDRSKTRKQVGPLLREAMKSG